MVEARRHGGGNERGHCPSYAGSSSSCVMASGMRGSLEGMEVIGQKGGGAGQTRLPGSISFMLWTKDPLQFPDSQPFL